MSKMNGYVSGGQLTSHGTSAVTVTYDAATQVTIVEGAATPSPTNVPTSKVSASEKQLQVILVSHDSLFLFTFLFVFIEY